MRSFLFKILYFFLTTLKGLNYTHTPIQIFILLKAYLYYNMNRVCILSACPSCYVIFLHCLMFLIFSLLSQIENCQSIIETYNLWPIICLPQLQLKFEKIYTTISRYRLQLLFLGLIAQNMQIIVRKYFIKRTRIWLFCFCHACARLARF